jgi:hypothetical protein
MTIRHAIWLSGVFAAVGMVAPAQEPPKKAPTANVVPGTFRAQLVVDNRFKEPVKQPDNTTVPDTRNRTGKIHCLVCENGLSPVVAIFVRADIKAPKAGDPDPTAGLSKLIKGEDALIPKYRSDKLATFVMVLSLEGGKKPVAVKDVADPVVADKEFPDDDNRDAKAQDVRDLFARTMADNVPFGLAPATSTSATAFDIKAATPVTVIIYNRMRIVQRWELKLAEITDDKITEILNATEAMVTGKK